MTGTVNGREIVYEDLRQICINKKSSADWWVYSLSFSQLCLVPGVDINKCSHEVMGMVGIPTSDIDSCVLNSFYNSSDQINSDNSLLRLERELFMKKGIQAWPTLIINNVTFRVKNTKFLFNFLINFLF